MEFALEGSIKQDATATENGPPEQVSTAIMDSGVTAHGLAMSRFMLSAAVSSRSAGEVRTERFLLNLWDTRPEVTIQGQPGMSGLCMDTRRKD